MGNAWTANYFDLDQETMQAILRMKERSHARIIQKLNNPLVSVLFLFVQLFAKTSRAIYNVSPVVERIIFFPIGAVYLFFNKMLVKRYYNDPLAIDNSSTE
jgi:hypothetical protein